MTYASHSSHAAPHTWDDDLQVVTDPTSRRRLAIGPHGSVMVLATLTRDPLTPHGH